MHAEGEGGVPRRLVERGHAGIHALEHVRRTQVGLGRRGQDARAERLGQQQHVPGLRARVGEHLVRMHKAGHTQAVLGLLVQNAVPARDDRARLIYLVIPAAQDGPHRAVGHAFGHAQQVERGFGLAAHGVNVRKGVGRRDLAEQIGVVRDGREKVHGLHDGQLVRHAVDRRVVARVEPHEQVGVAAHGQPVQQLREHARADLGPAARTAGELCQFDLRLHIGLLFVIFCKG